MKLADARRILAVAEGAEHDEINRKYRWLVKKYHPDNFETGDAEKFILITGAYTLLKAYRSGVGIDDEVDEEIYFFNGLRDKINAHYDTLTDRYEADLRDCVARLDRGLRQEADSIPSLEALRQAVQAGFKDKLLDSVAQITTFTKKLRKDLGGKKGDFVTGWFDEMLQFRRKYWWYTLYRNPVVVIEGVSQGFIHIVNALPKLADPNIYEFVKAIYWTWPIILAVGALALFFQFIYLSPRNTIIPPKLSLPALHSKLAVLASSIGTSPALLAVGGAGAGAIIGSIIFPGVGTIVGGLIGAAAGAWGDDLDARKSTICTAIVHEEELAVDELLVQLRLWVETAKVMLFDLSRAHMLETSRKLAKRIGPNELKRLEHRNLERDRKAA